MTLVRLDDPTAIRDSRLLGLFHYWHGKCQGRVMPARRDIDPIEMRQWLGNLLLVDFPPDPLQYRIRLDGVNLVQFYNSSREGKGVEVMTSEEERRIVLPQYMTVLENKQPAYYESEFVTSEGIVTSQRKLLLPLSEDGQRVNMVLGGIYFDRVEVSAFSARAGRCRRTALRARRRTRTGSRCIIALVHGPSIRHSSCTALIRIGNTSSAIGSRETAKAANAASMASAPPLAPMLLSREITGSIMHLSVGRAASPSIGSDF